MNKTVIESEEYISNLKENIELVIKCSTYSEICTYINFLSQMKEDLKDNYLNEYYEIVRKLEENSDKKSKRLQYKLYICYLKENNSNVIFSFEEFITFSKLTYIIINNDDETDIFNSKLNMILDALNEKKNNLLKEELNHVNLENDEVTKLLSDNRVKMLKNM